MIGGMAYSVRHWPEVALGQPFTPYPRASEPDRPNCTNPSLMRELSCETISLCVKIVGFGKIFVKPGRAGYRMTCTFFGNPRMSNCRHIVLLASYNEWMNARLYEGAGKLPAQELSADRKAFFGSLIGTLNHIAVADTIWLKRFSTHPSNHAALDPVRKLRAPLALNEVLFTDLQQLFSYRKMLDEVIKQWATALTEEDLAHVLRYSNMKGIPAKKSFFSLAMNFFNHQTHHRGQATTLLFQAGVDVGVTDLLALIPDEVNA